MVGAKRVLKQQQVWPLRLWLDQRRRLRDRALFDFAIDSQLAGTRMARDGVVDAPRRG